MNKSTYDEFCKGIDGGVNRVETVYNSTGDLTILRMFLRSGGVIEIDAQLKIQEPSLVTPYLDVSVLVD